MYELETMQMKNFMIKSSLPVRYNIHSFASLNITTIAKKRDYFDLRKRTYIIDNNVYKNCRAGTVDINEKYNHLICTCGDF
jgi:hypothetical protein